MLQDKLRNSKSDKPIFYYEKGATPDPNAIWKGPGGGKSAFYTTWSYIALAVTCIFAIIFIPILRTNSKLASSKFSIIGIALIIGFAVNSVAVAVTSQAMLDFSWKPIDPNNDVLITEKWVKDFNKLNVTIHIFPLIFSLILLASIITVPWSGDKKTLYIISCAIPIIYLIIWSCVPVPIKKGSDKKTNPFNKPSVVYNSPQLSVEILLPVTILLVCALYVYAIRGNKKM
jgi:hypothetical protein